MKFGGGLNSSPAAPGMTATLPGLTPSRLTMSSRADRERAISASASRASKATTRAGCWTVTSPTLQRAQHVGQALSAPSPEQRAYRPHLRVPLPDGRLQTLYVRQLLVDERAQMLYVSVLLNDSRFQFVV